MFRQMLMSGATRLLAPQDDQGSEYEDPEDNLDELEDELGDQDQDEDEVEEQDEDQEEDEVDAAGQQQQQRQPTRGENRVARATREAAEAKRERDQLRQDMERLRQQINNPPAPQETMAQRNERLANMEPWERSEYLRQESEARTAATLQRIEFNANESADKTAYDALCQRVPAAAKLRNEVEQRLAEMRAGGTTAPREVVLKYLLGDRALANASKATGRAQRSADTRRQQQTARPPKGKGDSVSADNGRAKTVADFERQFGDTSI